MTQNVDDIKSGYALFQQPEYQDLIASKRRDFEAAYDAEKVKEIFEWTTTKEYQEINFNRKHITIDPAKACQPLGSVLCALGFENTLPYVHGSQGCVAYFRTYFNRHFKEPVACVSDSMTEDAAVFGGQNNMFQGLQNAYALYKPEMIAVSTTCMAEVIGDDLNAFINNAKEGGYLPKTVPTPFAHTPSFVGSHLTGWDSMFEGVLRHFTLNSGETYQPGSNGKLNIVPGFETYLGNYRVIQRMLDEMNVDYAYLCDPSEVLDTPADGEYRMYAGGTPVAQVKDAPNAKATLLLQGTQLPKTKKFIENNWQQDVPQIDIPMGLEWTDNFLMKVAELSGQPIPDSITKERGRLVDMMTDSHTWLHGLKVSLYGDPDYLLGMCKFLTELGCEIKHVLCHNGAKRWKKTIETMLAQTPYGEEAQVLVGKDLWHLRSLMFTEKPDLLIGNSYGKFIQRDTKAKGDEFEVPLVRIGFPIFDRHHLHREATLGYEGAMSILTTLTNEVLAKLDRETMVMGTTDLGFDLVR
ncbi:nitrogenase molybdenum-iron protein subunit beta [Vibrio mangrovi]|uniref:Nitrogenase molybdenum-iron protein beta chain n=1 Tax=Vibrio mangrovi TaxID=474394 RepID=A0A1Y6IQW6_9VIBR|nr:nitrogenase molybdenum-iron protein subunit beta [Vibrio mangrovi]MDW6004013.1 nitrogenase molybdenum-iron protein subunit beta [Vibrio mangrovi]SMR99190.1 Nitrogenase molybdenum-iron protein beta chain [Vibrio mangrovi]